MGWINYIVQNVTEAYGLFAAMLPEQYLIVFKLLIFSVIISLYAMFTWKFYQSLSKRDLIKLDLSKYNRLSHPILKKLFATVLYIVEYVVILPFLIFFWMAVLGIIILVMSQEQTIDQVLLISAGIVAAVRVLSYYHEDLSRDVAKMFPLAIMSIFLITPGFFDVQRILAGLTQVEGFIIHAFYYISFIVFLEFVLRVLTLISGRNDKGEEELE